MTAPFMGEDKEEIIQNEILQAAIQLYQKYGLNKVTMDDIARAVGKGRSSLYYYYKNREDIFDAVMQAMIAEIIQKISNAVQPASGLEEKIQAFCRAKLKTSEHWHSFFRALETGMGSEEITRHTAAINTVHMQLMKRESALLHQVFGDAIRAGQIRDAGKKELDIHISILLTSIRGIKREHLNNNEQFHDLRALVATLSSMAVKSLQ